MEESDEILSILKIEIIQTEQQRKKIENNNN